MYEIDINDVIEQTREGKSLIEISRDSGASIKFIRKLQEEAMEDGFLTPAEIDEGGDESGQVSLTLLARGDVVPLKSGLNWGLANAHVSPYDAYIAIRIAHLKAGFFHRHGVIYSAKWDDGNIMRLVAEGTQRLNGEGTYPKQLSSHPDKFVLGAYMRERLKVPAPEPITKNHLNSYGRTDVTVRFVGKDELELDFSVD